jgi:glycosyltransferase involved in cell wall biosynthesis
VRPTQLASNFTQIHREIDQAEQIPTYTVSDFLRKQMRRAGCAPDHLHTLHSPAPSAEGSFTPVPRGGIPRFLFLGRLVPEKGLDWVLRALAQTETRVHLDVAGEGRKRSDMEVLAEELGVRPQVSFHGWVEPEDVPSFMEKSRAVLFPSVWHEPAGLITLEAAAQGRPLIASRVGGIPEYTNDDRAILVDVRDVEGLADALSQLARNPDRADQLGQEGLNAAQSEFSMDQFLDPLHAFYKLSQTNK